MLQDGESSEDVAKFLFCYIAETLSSMVSDIFSRFGELPLVFAGGVMSNTIIKDILKSRFFAFFAEPEFSCDNAAGIAFLTFLKNE